MVCIRGLITVHNFLFSDRHYMGAFSNIIQLLTLYLQPFPKKASHPTLDKPGWTDCWFTLVSKHWYFWIQCLVPMWGSLIVCVAYLCNLFVARAEKVVTRWSMNIGKTTMVNFMTRVMTHLWQIWTTPKDIHVNPQTHKHRDDPEKGKGINKVRVLPKVL